MRGRVSVYCFGLLEHGSLVIRFRMTHILGCIAVPSAKSIKVDRLASGRYFTPAVVNRAEPPTGP